MINFCANNYLGLADHPEVIEAGRAAMLTHGSGMASVRFICGTQTLHKTLEARIAGYVGKEDAILFAACFRRQWRGVSSPCWAKKTPSSPTA